MRRSSGDPRRLRGRRPALVGGLVASLVVVGLGVALAPSSGSAGGPHLVDAPPGATWTPAFAEEFGSSSTDAFVEEGRWHVGWYGDGRLTQPVNGDETALYHRDQLQVQDGLGRFSVRPNEAGLADGGVGAPHLAAMVNTDPAQVEGGVTIGYGYVEVRMQQPAGSASEELWPAFWLNGDPWPTAMEIDVVEGDGTDGGCSFNIHHGPAGTDVTNLNGIDRSRTVPGATSGMHVYGADIRPDGITFHYDGRPVYTWSGPVPDAQRYLAVGLSTGGTVAREATLLVDWVRAWHRSDGG